MRLPVDALTMMGLDFPYAAAAVVSMAALKIICLVAVCVAVSTLLSSTVAGSRNYCLYDQGDEQARAHVERYLDLLRFVWEIS